MDYVAIGGLKIKASQGGRVNLGISSFIRENLNGIPSDGAVAISELAKAVRTKFPHIEQNQSYVRVNMVLKKLTAFGRFENKEGKTFIARVAKEPETDTEEKETEGELSEEEKAELSELEQAEASSQ